MRKTSLTPKSHLFIILVFSLILGSCALSAPETNPGNPPSSTIPHEQASATPQPETAQEPTLGLPNPASTFCAEQGYKLEIRTAADGSQAGFCIFPDRSECDEWAFFRGECAAASSAGASDTPATGAAPQITPQEIILPRGTLVNPGVNQELTLYNPAGDVVGAWQTTLPAPNGTIHIAGSIASGVGNTPLVFPGTQNEILGLKVSQDGQISGLLDFPRGIVFTDLTGAPGNPWVAYSVIEPQRDGASLVSKLYIGEYDKLPAIEPTIVVENKEARILLPVALRMQSGVPEGVWYTYGLWGIGGDSFVAPNAGLYYLDLVSGSTHEYLTIDQRFSNLSPDQTWAAWTPDQPNAAMTLTNLVSGETISFPLLPDSERGAVHAFISPDNTYIAWMEGKGNAFDGNLEATLRAGTPDGKVIAEFPADAFNEVSKAGVGGLIQTLGWLDPHTLLVQTYLPGDEGSGEIVRLDAISGEISPYTAGRFVGFAYP